MAWQVRSDATILVQRRKEPLGSPSLFFLTPHGDALLNINGEVGDKRNTWRPVIGALVRVRDSLVTCHRTSGLVVLAFLFSLSLLLLFLKISYKLIWTIKIIKLVLLFLETKLKTLKLNKNAKQILKSNKMN